MNTIYHIIGVIVFWGAIISAIWYLSATFYYRVWQEYKFRFWVYQVVEYIRFMRRFKTLKADNFGEMHDMNWRVIEIHHANNVSIAFPLMLLIMDVLGLYAKG